ncbi:type IX secretion system anionic LPS delivery protein PorZ [Chryseobacterium oryctis]|uniref:T9SS type A sorting domain-containing protein n=1 Tax=Chryseobacterium oryctis TaxID=2952618 RepID=A0ABT3HRL5_9FLAO|nr:T9SS type A sorting domain-containing protein [Chryseobacterium oryctis]MCW3162429.1 T9SS type A sorting domain-containing protein [Chryseobacterium oryctis]
MKKLLISLGILASLQFVNAQNISSKKWADLFSYNNVLAMKESNGKIVAATENGIFYYTISTGEITKLSKANGLHDVKISAFDYNPQTNIGLVGYQNGSLDVITPEGVTYVVDIPLATGYTGNKKINHISITGNKAIISVGYGVSVFDLTKKEFNDSAFFMNGGVYEASNEAALVGNKVFSVTNSGLKSHEMNTTFPVYSTWTTEMTGSFTQIDSESVLSFGSSAVAYLYNNGVSTPLPQSFGGIRDIVVTNNDIVVTDASRIYTFSTNGTTTGNTSIGEECNTATKVNGKIYGGTKLSGIKTEDGTIFKPDGPYSNISYKISLLNDQIWVATGGKVGYNDPTPGRNIGYYHFDGSKWIYPDYFANNPIQFNILDVVPNPSNPSEVFFTNHIHALNQKGIYKMEDDAFKKVYKNNDSAPNLNRITGLTFDENNNLFAAVCFIEGGSANTGYFFYNKSADGFTLVPIINAGGSQKPITKDGILYLPSPFFDPGGLIIKEYSSNPTSTTTPYKIIQKGNGLPASGTVSAAIDKDDNVWIGTRLGLRILSNPKAAITEPSPQAVPVIIEQNGIAEELFRDNTILQIEVDGGNHKWVAVEDGGVYYLSPDGERTIKHFTKENSPLPTNSVTDIKVDKKTGKVYFVTLDGIVTYQGDVAEVTSDFGNVLVYPNPVVYSNFKGLVTIKGLAEKTNIRIVDAAGNVVHSAVARGGYYEWDLNNQKGKRVASGIYFVLMTNEDGSDKATAKIGVVN